MDIDRASKIFVTELRSGKLGPMTLESPEMMEREVIEMPNALPKKRRPRKLIAVFAKQRFVKREKNAKVAVSGNEIDGKCSPLVSNGSGA